MIIQNMTRTRTCQWCGKTFRVPRTRKYNATKYCCKKHSRLAKREQDNKAQKKYKKLYHWLLKDADKWQIGEVRLGETPEQDFEEEYRLVHKELNRIKRRK